MHSPLIALVWKEWHEQKWKLASCCAVLASPMLVLFAKAQDDFAGDLTVMLTMAGAFFLPVFIAMGLVASERSRRTFGTLRALPTRPLTVLGVKALVGALACVIPVAAVILVAWFLQRGDGALPGLKHGTIWVFVWAVAYAFIWSLVVGIRQPTELRAGLMSIVMMTVWFVLAAAWLRPRHGPIWCWWVNPGVCLPLTDGSPSVGPVWGIMLVQLAVIGLLILWAAWRITLPVAGQRSIAEGRRKAAGGGGSVLRSMRTALGAMVWKERRELRAVVLVGVVAFVIAPMSMAWLEHTPSRQDYFGTHPGVPWWRYALVLVTSRVGYACPLVIECVQVGGNILAIMAAVGAVCRDLTPKLADFRRSRPITATQWFWTKYLSGLTTVLLITMIPLALIVMMGDTGRTSPNARLSILYFAPIFILIYSVSFLLACLLRHTVYAGILAVGAMLALYASPYHSDMWLPAFGVVKWTSPADPVYVTFVAVITLLATAATLLTWQAIRLDWHWRWST